MRILLGGHLTFYHPQKSKWLEVELDGPTSLVEILEGSRIPAGEVYLIVVNGIQTDLQGTIVSEQDDVKLYSAMGGG